jgi:tripartite-type tricarboxylate transporter receptor subunit TctC
MPLTRIALIALALVAAVAPLASEAAYPDKPIRLIIPFSAGASADNYARIAASKLTERLGQPVIVEARPGANGIIATELVAKAPPDGYTLLLVNSAFSINRALYKKLPFDAERDFVATGLVAIPSSLMLVAHPSLPARTERELIELAREKPNQISYGSAGVGNVLHLTGETFNALAGVKLLHVPYKGAAPALNDLLAGQVHLMWNASGLVLPHARAGRLRVLAASGTRRAPDFPDVPTLHEAGVTGYNVTSWFGILAPSATPKDIVQRLRTETHHSMQQPDARERLVQFGADPPDMTPEEFTVFVQQDAVRTAEIVKRVGLALETPK